MNFFCTILVPFIKSIKENGNYIFNMHTTLVNLFKCIAFLYNKFYLIQKKMNLYKYLTC